MYSAYKLNKQGDNIQPCRTPFPILNQSVVLFKVPTRIQVSQETGKVVWYSHLFMNFPQFVVIHAVKGFSVVNEAEVDAFLEFPCFLYDPMNAIWSLVPLCSVASVMSDSVWPHGLWSTRLLCPWNFPSKNTGVGCHFLLQGIFPTQESNSHLLCLLHWQILYHCVVPLPFLNPACTSGSS